MIVVACKLSHGLSITHMGQVININGANANHNKDMPAPNGFAPDSPLTSSGFGLTTLDGPDEAAFLDWTKKAVYAESGDKLAEPFLAIENGSLSWYKSENDARKETSKAASSVKTGTEGLDGDKEIKQSSEGTGLVAGDAA